jgi:hypothetical protein
MRADGAACIYADHSSNSLIIERLVTSGKLAIPRGYCLGSKIFVYF